MLVIPICVVYNDMCRVCDTVILTRNWYTYTKSRLSVHVCVSPRLIKIGYQCGYFFYPTVTVLTFTLGSVDSLCFSLINDYVGLKNYGALLMISRTLFRVPTCDLMYMCYHNSVLFTTRPRECMKKVGSNNVRPHLLATTC